MKYSLINNQEKSSLKTTLLLVFVVMSLCHLSAQTRNLSVEGPGDQMGVIHSTDAKTSGVELIRGNSLSESDWRIVNDNGVFRLQSQTNNFMTNGVNRFSLDDSGHFGIGCTNPQAKLSICSGEMAFANAISEGAADKISLDGYAFDQPFMVGLGYETSTVSSQNGTQEFSDLYYKAEGSHRWYTNTNADLGLSASMVIDRDGQVGIATYTPETQLHILGGREASLTEQGYLVLGDLSTTNLVLDENEIQSRRGTESAGLFIQPHGGDLAVDGNTLYLDASANEIGVGTASPQNKLHVMGGTDAGLGGGGYIQMGNLTGNNIVMDENEIMARSNGGDSPLYLQHDGGEISMGVSSGSINAKLNIQDDGHQMYIRNANDTDNDWWIGASAATWGVGADKFIFDDDSNSNNPLLMLDGAVDGVGINTNVVPAGYRLAVNGNVICEEVRVELEDEWPDYVFKEDYQLLSIDELETSIQENGHLPGIPSANEVKNAGQHLGDIQKRMLEKVEEMSLYIIQLKKENDKLKERVEALEEKN